MSSTQNQYSKENNFPGDQNLIKSDIEAKGMINLNQFIFSFYFFKHTTDARVHKSLIFY